MVALQTNRVFIPPFISLAFFVALACLGLGYIDKETRTLSDLFTAQNIFALLLYFLPTYFICGLFHSYIFKKLNPAKKMCYSLLAGIPLGFTLVILCFVFLGSFHFSNS